MYAIFFTNQGHAVPKDNVFHKLKKYLQRVDQLLISVVLGYCITMLHHTKRSLYASIWNRKRLLSFLNLLIRQILTLVIFPISEAQKNTLLKEDIKRAKNLFRLFSSVWTVYLEQIMKIPGIKRPKLCVYRMMVNILKDWNNHFGIFVKHLGKLTQLHSYLNTPRIMVISVSKYI